MDNCGCKTVTVKTAKAWAIVKANGKFVPYDKNENPVALFMRRSQADLVSIGPPERVVRVEIRELKPAKGGKVKR